MKPKQDQLLIGEEDVPSIVPPAPTVTIQPAKTSYMIQLALEKGAGIEVIERLWALQKEIDAQAAKREYHAAMSHVQGQVKAVFADLINMQTESKYASYKALDDAVRPYYTAAGFALKFDTEDCSQPDTLMVVCDVIHSGGHSERARIPIPIVTVGPQGKAVMTKTHAGVTAFTYGKKELLKAVFNIPVYGQKEDNDGNADSDEVFDDDAATGPHNMQEALEWIANANSVNELTKIYLPLYQKAQDAKNKPAMQQLLSAKNKRYKELA